ncbi:hypothetical protein A4R26_06855 [Niastella populi]|uniref:Uncharacterized protein n=1 Tax=Niastella populi TaxID=550983 RepID=A0A1V9F607_9BACT|nr:hypothetical protein A4R26_06855 [Niastella populi]
MWLNKTYNCYFNISLQAGPAFGAITTCSARGNMWNRESTTTGEIFLQIDRIFCRRHKKTRLP